ncbi:snoRNA-binding protein [Saitoella coloradoensis]
MGKDSKDKKEKKERRKSAVVEEAGDVSMVDASGDKSDNYEARLAAVNEIAKPLAPKKLNKKLLKTVKKAAKAKQIKRGVKEVVKALRKQQKGLVIIAGDISPIDVISHIPVLCEDADVPYVFVPSKEDLGAAGATKRPTSCVMIAPGSGKKKGDKEGKEEDYLELYQEVSKEVKKADEW